MALEKDRVVTVIPVYRQDPTTAEVERITVSKEQFPGQIRFLGPTGFDFAIYQELVPQARPITLDGSWFVSNESYSNLMLQPWFYDRFRSFQFMLIWQLDALLIRKPCIGNFSRLDYIGAPWSQAFRLGWNPFTKSLGNGPGVRLRRRVLVGNGGLSLRRISAFRRVSRLLPPIRSRINEDLIYAFFGPLLGLRIADPALARSTFMETEAQNWTSGDPLPSVDGFHALNIHSPALERLIISSRMPAA